MEASITFKKVGQIIDGNTVLAGLSFGIEKNTTVAVIGDNDDLGITEFLRIIAGYHIPNYGSIYIHGFDSRKRGAEIRKLVGYVPFENDMDPWLTAGQNIHYLNSYYKLDTNQMTKRFDHCVDALEIRDKLDIEVNKLSQGVLRKLTLLRELSRDPKILVLDNPTAFMNAKDRGLTWDLLHSLNHKITIIYSSSSLYTIESFHDRILVFHDGKIDLDNNFNDMLRNWIGQYQYTIMFEEFSLVQFNTIKKIEGILAPKKDGQILMFNANNRSVLIRLMALLSGAVIIDINMKKLHLNDLLLARYENEKII